MKTQCTYATAIITIIIATTIPATAQTIDPPEMAVVPGTDYEQNGPTYSYLIGKYEITNTQYCAFLNNAESILHFDPQDPRCAYFWVDETNGTVYSEDINAYSSNTDKLNRRLYSTSDFPDSKIDYSSSQPYGSRFSVQYGYDNIPVGTVSWLGAAKFCNWLTIDQGMSQQDCCYREGYTAEDWYAVTAANFNSNGLLQQERLDLVRNYRGYRLPMDGLNYDLGGPSVAHSWNMDANPYNEWYKAAAFDPNAPDTLRDGPGDYEQVQPYHWIFGFGADTYTDPDANLGNTGFFFPHPYSEATPFGYYNGINTLYDGTVTADTRNRYGLYDMCGNMAEWMTDTALESPWGSNYRVVRGGKWAVSDVKWATNTLRQITSARYSAENNIGFRLLRSPGYGDFNADGNIDSADYTFFTESMTGPATEVAPGQGHEACDYNGDNHVDMRDVAQLQLLH